MPTYDYAKETMRGGKSQLTLNASDSSTNKTKGGLDKDYALRWSLGKMETFTFLVPGLYGGSNGGNEHTADSKKITMQFDENGICDACRTAEIKDSINGVFRKGIYKDEFEYEECEDIIKEPVIHLKNNIIIKDISLNFPILEKLQQANQFVENLENNK
jgi:hypothetical protein